MKALSGERLRGKGRHWCNLQVMCDPCMSALSVSLSAELAAKISTRTAYSAVRCDPTVS